METNAKYFYGQSGRVPKQFVYLNIVWGIYMAWSAWFLDGPDILSGALVILVGNELVRRSLIQRGEIIN